MEFVTSVVTEGKLVCFQDILRWYFNMSMLFVMSVPVGGRTLILRKFLRRGPSGHIKKKKNVRNIMTDHSFVGLMLIGCLSYDISRASLDTCN